MTCRIHPVLYTVTKLRARPSSQQRPQGVLFVENICKICASLRQRKFRQRQTSTSSKNRSHTT